MKRAFEEELTSDAENSNKRRTPNQTFAIDPALFETQDSNAGRSQYSRDSYGRRIDQSNSHRITQRSPGTFPTSRRDVQRRLNSHIPPRLGVTPIGPSQPRPHYPSTYQSPSGYPDVGLVDSGGSRDRVLKSNPVPETAGALDFPAAQTEASIAARKKTKKRVTRSSRKRSSTDAGLLSADSEDSLEDTTLESWKSTRRSKRTKTSPKDKNASDEGEERIRKISKLKVKIAEGKAPKKGSLGPNGEVRTREDGRMEFRDVNNLEWTLAAYHNDYRRQFLDEAAEDGDFDHTPTCGEADDDETSFEPEQKSWGSSRANWQNIITADGKKVMFEIDKPESRRPPYEPSNWIHDGLVLLDLKNHPVKDWPGLNKTLSTEIESWRWEALMRMYPWLTVADLLARIPHTRKTRGRVLPLQTPQAFTNRAHRFRVVNQIPASNPKNGSGAYKEEILKNLAKKSANTTEGLSTLDHDQINEVRKLNKGKFKENSRYVVKDKDSTETSLPSKKRRVNRDEDTESEFEQEAPKAKKLYPRMQQNWGVEVSSLNDLIPESVDDDNNGGTYLEGTGFYDEPTDTAGLWEDQEQEACPTDTTRSQGDHADLVPLFMSIDDRELALVEDEYWTSPLAVIQARRDGNQQTRQIGVYWYSQSTPRYVAADGNIVEDVVDGAFWNTIMAEEPIPDDFQDTSQVDSANNNATPSLQSNLLTTFDPLFNAQTHEGHQDFPTQNSNNLQATAFASWQALPNQIGRYQTQADISDEVWRNHHGSAGF